MKEIAIEARCLHKEFTTRTGFWRNRSKTNIAVDDVSFTVAKGELFGLLGPNGAGKTTTVKMLSTLLTPTSGSASIFGLDLVKQTQNIRERIGFTFGGSRGLYGRLSARDNLKYFCELYGLEPAVSNKRIPEMLELVGLQGRSEDRVETFSSGMQQRLHLARALLHDPELIFLDEPTVGIDPIGARELRATITELLRRGKTILLTTHYMAEAEELCDRIAIIKNGHIIALDSPAALKKNIPGETVICVQIPREHLYQLKNCLDQLDRKIQVEDKEPGSLITATIRSKEPGVVMHLLSPLIEGKLIQGLEVRNQTLEDVYVAIIQGEVGC